VVIGGGPVGRRKARMLRAAGATVRLISPLDGEAANLPGIEIVDRPYRPGDLAGAFLAFAAAGDRQINAAVAREARTLGIPVNVADLPGEGDFSLPAVLRRGDLALAVSTGGTSPALAAVIRDRLEESFGPEWETALAIAAALRRKKLTLPEETEYNHAILRRLLEGGLLSLIADGRAAELDRLLLSVCGSGCSLPELGVRLPKGKT
jgi:precorrin-2 dehydrogenase/sirohydrochlorin ferrochelatase